MELRLLFCAFGLSVNTVLPLVTAELTSKPSEPDPSFFAKQSDPDNLMHSTFLISFLKTNT